jgi:phosphoglycerate kinase
VERNGQRTECEFGQLQGHPFYDIGPRTAERFAGIVRSSQVVFANGPMGLFEKEAFQKGTVTVLDALAECSGITVVGGGHLGAMVRKMGLLDRITHISTGGGATLKFLTGKQLVLVDALKAAAQRMDS